MGTDDSTGKSRALDARTRSKLLLTAFSVGLFLGFVIAQRTYLSVQASIHDMPPDYTHSRRSTAQQSNTLKKKLLQVAPQREVLVTISDSNLMKGERMLETWLKSVRDSGVENYLIVAIDEQLVEMLKPLDAHVHLHKIDLTSSPQHNTGANHAISAEKFGILREFLALGWRVLLSDTDIAVLQDPFQHLYRDHDVEAMSDGFDSDSAYGFIDGFDDPSMGWARYAQAIKHFNLNSGLFYLNANSRTVELMERLKKRLSTTKYWDQTAFNEEIFFLSHGDYKSPQVTVRVMDINKFMNSKYLFKTVRHLPKNKQPQPVMVHINYHPDKHARMKAVIDYFRNGNEHALDKFPGGSEPGT